MKRILSLFAVSFLAVASIGTIVSCSNNNKPKTSNTNNLVNKIKNGQTNIHLPIGTNVSTTNQNTIKVMKDALKSNDNLSDTDIAGLTFEDGNLNYITYTKINITVKLGTDNPEQVNNIQFKINSNVPPKPGLGLGKSKNVPYIDISSISSGKNDLTPSDIYNKFGQHQIMLAFVSAYNPNGASWNTKDKFSDMNTSEAIWIKKYQSLGGKIGISFGGAVASQGKTTPWDKLSTSSLTNMLNIAVNKYHVKAIDYDIEPPTAFNVNHMTNLVNATNNILNDNPHLDISLTLASIPVDRHGIKFWGTSSDHSSSAVSVFKNFKKTPIINPMAFDFGSYYVPTSGDYLKAIEGVAMQTNGYWAKIFNIDPNKFLNNNIQVTTMIGKSDQHGTRELLTKEEAIAFAKWAKQNKLFRLSYWCLNRDFPGNPVPVTEHNNGTNNPEGTYTKVNLDYFEN